LYVIDGTTINADPEKEDPVLVFKLNAFRIITRGGDPAVRYWDFKVPKRGYVQVDSSGGTESYHNPADQRVDESGGTGATGSGKPRKPRKRRLRGGARSTLAALADVATNPKGAIEELKGLFTHAAALFSDMKNIGGNLRVHGKAIFVLVIKYLPLAGAPGYTAATVLERMPIDKYIEVAASILDFFTGKGDLMHMLTSMADLVGDIFNQLKDLIPQIIAKVGHEVSEAIGSSNTAAGLANLFGANYELPAVRQAREAQAVENAKYQADQEATKVKNAAKQAQYDKDQAAFLEKDKKDNAAKFVEFQKKNYKDTLIDTLKYEPEDVAHYDPPESMPLTAAEKAFMTAKLASYADGLEKNGYHAPEGTPKGVVLDETALEKLRADAVASSKTMDAVWAKANDPALKAKALAGDKPSQDLILMYYGRIQQPSDKPYVAGYINGDGQMSQAGVQFLAGKNVRAAKEYMLSDADYNRLQRDKADIAQGSTLPPAEATWYNATTSGYDPRDTPTQKFDVNTAGGNVSGGSKPRITASKTHHAANAHHAFHHLKVRAERMGRRVHLDTLDPFFFEGTVNGRLAGSGKRSRDELGHDEEPTAAEIAAAHARADHSARAARSDSHFSSIEARLNKLSQDMFGKSADALDDDENEKLDAAFRAENGDVSEEEEEEEEEEDEPEPDRTEVIMGRSKRPNKIRKALKYMRKLKFPARLAKYHAEKAQEQAYTSGQKHTHNKMMREWNKANHIPDDEADTEFESDSDASSGEELPPRFDYTKYFKRKDKSSVRKRK